MKKIVFGIVFAISGAALCIALARIGVFSAVISLYIAGVVPGTQQYLAPSVLITLYVLSFIGIAIGIFRPSVFKQVSMFGLQLLSRNRK